jgi:hypothetical protein
MPKVLIIEPTIVTFADDRGGVPAHSGESPDVSKDVARALVNASRALYVDRKDDPSRGAINTASPEMLKAAAAMQAARKKPASADDKKQGEDA